MSVFELKQAYCKLLENDVTPEELRFFCMGQELKDNLFLYSYDIIDEMAIQAMIRKSNTAN